MRIFLGFAAASTIGGAVAAGCGSSSSPSTPVDSGAGDVTTEAMPQPEAAVETGPDVVEAGPDVCVPDSSLSSIPVPDAALNEAGATAAGCIQCVAQTAVCQPLVMECNQNCACIAAFQQFSLCLAQGGSLLLCAGSDLTGLSAIGIDAGATGCVTSCAIACGYTLPTGDGGHPEAGGEGGTDAGGD
jgi:hypothetical protein